MSTAARDLLRHLHSALPDPSFLNLSYVLGIAGPLDVDALAWAFDRVAETFPSLGAMSGDEIFAWHDLSPSAAQTDLLRMISDVQRYVFDIGSDPLMVCHVMTLDPERHVLVMSVHHWAVDGWSLGAIARAMAGWYAGLRAGRSPEINDVLDAADAKPLSEPRMNRERGALARDFAGLSAEAVAPVQDARPGDPLIRLVRSYPKSLPAALEAHATQRRVTPFAFLAGTVAQHVLRALDRAEMLVGTTILNRHSTSDLLVDAPLYQGALLRIAQHDPWPRIGSRVASASTRMLPYAEQLELAGTALGGGSPPAHPPLFVFADTHPLADLTFDGTSIHFLEVAGDAAHPLPAVRMADIAFFWRSGPGGATGNLFLPAALRPLGDVLMAEIDADIKRRVGHLGAEAPDLQPWAPGLMARAAPLVDGLSPVGRISL